MIIVIGIPKEKSCTAWGRLGIRELDKEMSMRVLRHEPDELDRDGARNFDTVPLHTDFPVEHDITGKNERDHDTFGW